MFTIRDFYSELRDSSLLLLGIRALLWATHGIYCTDRLDVGLYFRPLPFLLIE
jgi:hypothetical protein